MITSNLIKPNRYQDSVTLMQTAVRLREIAGIADASLMMGTEPNKDLLREAGLLTSQGDAAGPNDLIVALAGDEAAVTLAGDEVEATLRAGTAATGERKREAPHSISAGLAELPDANLVLISTPGIYAAAEARKALQAGRHVMIFSDNVALADEVALKKLASERGLLLMGPDCGTAIIGGVPLGFANAVRRGTIGVVGASGTGTQEVTSLISRYGLGVSHAIGTGSRDIKKEVGGAMTIIGLRALLDDAATEVVVVVSKPPDADVDTAIADVAADASKPVVFCFLGSEGGDRLLNRGNSNLIAVGTLEDAARQAVAFAGGTPPAAGEPDAATVADIVRRLAPGQRYVRGLFSGGTFCYEAMLLLRDATGGVYSNTPLAPEWAVPKVGHSYKNTCRDLGADEFTVGRPHPMIDLGPRSERIIAEAADPEVAVILLDVVLGYGAHSDPAPALASSIGEAQRRAESEGRALAVIATVVGTDADPQDLERQEATLREAGVILAPSNAAAARTAAAIVAAAVRAER